jgi:predicted methyltransferase
MKRIQVLFGTILIGASLAACARMDRLDYTRIYSRAGWQKPDRVIETLAIPPGAVVADIGSGSGYFTIELARAVGPTGRVYAVDVDAAALEKLQARAAEAGISWIESKLVAGEESGLPRNVSVVFLCNSYHHLPDRPRYFARLRAELGADHRVAVVDHIHDLSGILRLFVSTGHWTPEALLLREMQAAGYELNERHDYLPTQNFHVYRPQSASATPRPASAGGVLP